MIWRNHERWYNVFYFYVRCTNRVCHIPKKVRGKTFWVVVYCTYRLVQYLCVYRNRKHINLQRFQSSLNICMLSNWINLYVLLAYTSNMFTPYNELRGREVVICMTRPFVSYSVSRFLSAQLLLNNWEQNFMKLCS